jgi:uroporphyrin-3 C-methyltransferase
MRSWRAETPDPDIQMSNEDEQKDAEFPDEDELVVDETEVEPASLPAPETAAADKKGSGGVAWLALIIAMIAAAGIGYMIFQDWRAESAAAQSASSLTELRNRLASSTESLSSLDRGLAGLSETDSRIASELNALQLDLENRISLLDSLPSRVSNLENSISTLQGVSTGARNTWLLAEAEYYMQIANAQLQLAGNPHLAALALGMADERIVQLSDPALTGVRRALSDELAALDVMEKPDIEGITLTLSSLARVVASLPLRQAASTGIDEDTAVDPDLSGANRAWASVKGAVSGLVRVTPPNEIAAPLMTPDAVYFLRTNLTLQLQAARLALLRGEQAVFEQSLDDAAHWLDLYFDAESAQVRGAKATLAEIRSGLFAIAPPDISESLRLLRQFNSISESAQ